MDRKNLIVKAQARRGKKGDVVLFLPNNKIAFPLGFTPEEWRWYLVEVVEERERYAKVRLHVHAPDTVDVINGYVEVKCQCGEVLWHGAPGVHDFPEDYRRLIPNFEKIAEFNVSVARLSDEVVKKVRELDEKVRLFEQRRLRLERAYEIIREKAHGYGYCYRDLRLVYFKHPEFSIKEGRLVFYRFRNGKFDGTVSAVVKHVPCGENCDPEIHCYDKVIDPEYGVLIACLESSDLEYTEPLNVDCELVSHAIARLNDEKIAEMKKIADEVLDALGYKVECRDGVPRGSDGTAPRDFAPWGHPGAVIAALMQISRVAGRLIYARAYERHVEKHGRCPHDWGTPTFSI